MTSNELKVAGAEISEEEKISYLIRTLPAFYAHIGDLIDALPVDELKLEYLKTKTILKIKTGQDDKVSSDKEAGAFIANKSKITCYNCGEEYIQRNFTKNSSRRKCHGRGSNYFGQTGKFRGNIPSRYPAFYFGSRRNQYYHRIETV